MRWNLEIYKAQSYAGRDRPNSRQAHGFLRARAALLSLAAVSIVGVPLIVATTETVRSQAVQLVRVDIAVVAKGYRTSKLMGSNVSNDKNEKIGTLDDIIIGQDRSLFAVLQVGGFLGIGGRLVAVPYQSLVVEDDGRKIQLPGASRDELNKLTEFKYRS